MAEAARVAGRLAGAVAYAHGEGVVHRDLKPDNVMVDGRGEPLVMDFGLAARAEADEGAERLTQEGVAVGTPAYMAPEQARGDVDRVGPPADQYALGCVLHELLTGRTPFAGPPEVQLLLHQTQPPASPRALRPEVPRDLASICLKCLEKAPADRYPSADALAADLDRYLRGEPVLARRHTPLYVAGKFVRRYRRGLTVAAAVLVLAVAGTAAAFVRITTERANAVAAGEREKGEREKAEKALAELDLSRKEAQVVGEVIDQAYTNIRDENIRHIKGLGATHEELAAIRLKGYQRLAEVTPDDPTVLPRLARGHFILGAIAAHVGRLDRATENLRKAAELYERLEQRHPDDRSYRMLRCRALCELGQALHTADLNPAARPVLEQALALADEGLRTDPGNPDLEYEAGQLAIRFGNVLPWQTEQPRKRALFARAEATHERLLRAGHRPADNHLNLALARYNAFFQSPDVDDRKAKLKMLEVNRAEFQAAQGLLPDSPTINFLAAYAMLDHAETVEVLNPPAAARADFDQAVAAVRELAKANPDAHRLNALLPTALKSSGMNSQRLGKLAEARASFEEALQLQPVIAARFNDRPGLAQSLLTLRHNFAEFLTTSGVTPDPVARAQEILKVRDQAVADGRRTSARFPANAKFNAAFAEALFRRVLIDEESGRAAAALPLATEFVRVCRERVIPHEPPQTRPDELLLWLQTAKQVFKAAGRSEEVLELSRPVTELAPHATADGLHCGCGILNECGAIHVKGKRPADAIAFYQKVIDLAGPVVEKRLWDFYLRDAVVNAQKALAEIHREAGDHGKEVHSLREQLRLWYEPYTQVRGKQFLEPGRPADKAEADAIRAEIARVPLNMRRFTIQSDFNGIKYPFHVYITGVKWPKHPLEDQARWLSEVRGGTIPKDVMDSFQRVHKIAHDNNVSFQDLCVQVFGTAAEEGPQLRIENPGGGPNEPAEESPKLAALKARAVELRTKLDDAAGDRATRAELAAAYVDVAEECGAAGRRAEAVAAFENGLRMVAQVLADDPGSRPAVELLARALRGLARVSAETGRLDQAVVTQIRFVEVAEQLSRWPAPPTPDGAAKPPAPTDWLAERTAGWITLGEVLELRKEPSEAARWYFKGVEVGNADAVKRAAKLATAAPFVMAAAPEDLRAAFLKAWKESPTPEKVPAQVLTELAALKAAREKDRKAALAKEQAARAAEVGAKADRYRRLADDHRKQNNPAGAADWLLEEVALREQQVKLVPADPTAKAAESAAAYALAAVSAELKRSPDAARWMERAVAGGHEAAAFEWADWHEEGRHVAKDADEATFWRAQAHSARGNRLFRDGKYADALPDYRAVTELKPRANVPFDRLGNCLGKLGRWDEAVAAYRRSHELSAADLGTVLNLLEALMAAGKAGEVPAVVAGLDKALTDPAAAPAETRRLALLHGFHAIALRVATDGAGETAPEKKLFELTAVPNFRVAGWTWDEIDGWLAKADLPAGKAAAVRRILEELKGNPQERATPFFPLAVGAKWGYAARRTNDPDGTYPDVTVEVTLKEKVGEVECYKLSRTGGGLDPSTEHLVVRYDGVYRVAENGKPLPAPQRVLALPPARGTTWANGQNKLGLLAATGIEVPAGRYETGWLVETTDGAGKSFRRAWYAENVGRVKIESGPEVLALKSYTPPKP